MKCTNQDESQPTEQLPCCKKSKLNTNPQMYLFNLFDKLQKHNTQKREKEQSLVNNKI